MIIGRQEDTCYGGRIDLLALAPDGALILIELKRGKTPREVVAQAIYNASYVGKIDTPRRATPRVDPERLPVGHPSAVFRRRVKLDRKPTLTPHQREEAWRRVAKGKEPIAGIARSYNVSRRTIQRLLHNGKNN